MHETFTVDFFTAPTVAFTILYVFIIIVRERRKVIHFNVSERPTAEGAAQQMIEACPWEKAPKYLIRDRDGVYGYVFQNR